MRVQDNEVHIMTWQLLGASPTTLAYSELFTALQQGTINAQENPISNIKLSGLLRSAEVPHQDRSHL